MSSGPKKWTAEEDRILYEQVLLAGQTEPKDWTSIAAALSGRTNKDCRKRWCNHLVGGLHKGPWEAGEDGRLKTAVRDKGQQWPLVAQAVRTRSADQCAKRWNQALNPALDRSKWSHEEQKTLLKAVQEHGRLWKLIQERYFPGRATNNVKNRYMTLTRRESVDVGTVLNRTVESMNEDEDLSTSSPECETVPDLVNGDTYSTNAVSSSFDQSFQLSTPHDNELDSYLNSQSMDLETYHTGDFLSTDYSMSSAHQASDAQLDQEKVLATTNSNNIDMLDFAPPAISARNSFDFSIPQTDELPAPPKFVLSIVDPSSEVVRDVMGVLVSSKASFKSEIQYSDSG